MSEQRYLGLGRRKRASASVALKSGTGKSTVNGREFGEYFTCKFMQEKVLAPLKNLSKENEFDITIQAKGGGIEAQSQAAQLGIARALVSMNEEDRSALKQQLFLRRDPRRRERKKFGRRGARRSFQFSKR